VETATWDGSLIRPISGRQSNIDEVETSGTSGNDKEMSALRKKESKPSSRLAWLGIEHDDYREIRADLDRLWRWRKNIEQAPGHAFRAVIAAIVTGLVAAVWLGIDVALGK
jgi:hypothetical protein